MSEYRVFDQEEKLGPPPWSHSDPKLKEWEAVHGHDARLKCYPEFGCAVLQHATDQVIDLATAFLDAWDKEHDGLCTRDELIQAGEALRVALKEIENA